MRRVEFWHLLICSKSERVRSCFHLFLVLPTLWAFVPGFLTAWSHVWFLDSAFLRNQWLIIWNQWLIIWLCSNDGSPKISHMHDFTVFKLAQFLSVLCILSLRLLALQFWFPWFLRFLCFSGFIFNFQGFPAFYGFHDFYFPGFCWAASSVWNRIISSVPNRAGSLVSHWVVSSVPNRVVCLIRGKNQCRSDVIWSLFCM